MTRWDPNDTDLYWVIGGRYVDLEFSNRSWSEVFGPFTSRYEAEAMWRKISFLYSHDARVRFTIVKDAEAEPAQAA